MKTWILKKNTKERDKQELNKGHRITGPFLGKWVNFKQVVLPRFKETKSNLAFLN